MHRGGEVLCFGVAVADDDIAIGSLAEPMSAFGAKTEILLECEQY